MSVRSVARQVGRFLLGTFVVLVIAAMVSCAYYLEHLRFTW